MNSPISAAYKRGFFPSKIAVAITKHGEGQDESFTMEGMNDENKYTCMNFRVTLNRSADIEMTNPPL